jgi:hypothetical protein
MEVIVPRIVGLLERAISAARGGWLNQPGATQERQDQADDGADELLPAEADAAARQVELISEDRANREEDAHDQHESGQDADCGGGSTLRSHGFTCAAPEACGSSTS